MALPKLTVPTHELVVPSSGKKLEYRPFLVKEEKILLMASEGDDEKSMIRALKQIITNCISETIDVNKLTTYDLEYMFLQLRAKSIGEVSELRYVCQNTIKDKKKERECGEPLKVLLDLSEIKVINFDDHEPNIPIVNKIGVVLKDPEVGLLEQHSLNALNEIGNLFEVLSDCVDYVYDGDQIFKDYKKEEIDDYLGSLTQQQFDGVKAFFETLPRLEKEINLNCKKCKNETTMTLRGLTDFFM